jgi:hypothetical protein
MTHKDADVWMLDKAYFNSFAAYPSRNQTNFQKLYDTTAESYFGEKLSLAQ